MEWITEGQFLSLCQMWQESFKLFSGWILPPDQPVDLVTVTTLQGLALIVLVDGSEVACMLFWMVRGGLSLTPKRFP